MSDHIVDLEYIRRLSEARPTVLQTLTYHELARGFITHEQIASHDGPVITFDILGHLATRELLRREQDKPAEELSA